MLKQTIWKALRSASCAVLISLLAGGIASTATSVAGAAYAWKHPLNTNNFLYYMPGGPEEHWLNGCIVGTRMLKIETGDVASVMAFDGVINGDGVALNTPCNVYDAWVQIVTFNGVGLDEGPIGYSYSDFGYYDVPSEDGTYYWGYGQSIGKLGQAIFGAHVCASNTNGLVKCWDITVF